jgi:hypothetical protein
MRWARSPARSAPTTCSAPSSRASASANEPAIRGLKRQAGRAVRQMDAPPCRWCCRAHRRSR